MSVMAIEKKLLSFEDIEAQTALELPEREALATVVIGCLAVCVGEITIRQISANVGAEICAQVLSINALLGQTVLTCTVNQRAQ